MTEPTYPYWLILGFLPFDLRIEYGRKQLEGGLIAFFWQLNFNWKRDSHLKLKMQLTLIHKIHDAI